MNIFVNFLEKSHYEIHLFRAILSLFQERTENKSFHEKPVHSSFQTIINFRYSREIGFLTGYETSVMEDAHVESVMIMGETLASNHPYNFANQDVTMRIQKLIPVMLEHR